MSSARIGDPGGLQEKRQTAPLSPQNIRQNKKTFTHTSIIPSSIYYYNISYILIKQHTQ
uniref:Uncharacterized protein n=1 Tax=virus sp. ctpeS3 TaxID=2826815 RepID=A0A8S5R9C1_9VIRU|nr:MAG TPA: hypothetical protein [virus sp. ctpeS3]